ncbi:hypothetical protein [Saccharopolyspora sp. NPDC049426]
MNSTVQPSGAEEFSAPRKGVVDVVAANSEFVAQQMNAVHDM